MIDFKKICESYKEEALKTLSEDIKINSVYDPSTVSIEAPYGKGVSECFKFLRELALKDGFEVDMCDGRCIEISCGEGERLIGIFAHQDVVPISGEWKHDPFSAYIDKEENRMYGRGTSDDKGPGISAYYALKALKDNGLIKNFRVKLVLGGDEERGSSCLSYYFEHLKKEYPTYGFTPDAEFPLIYGEKGICNYKHEGKLELNNVISIEAGVVSNSVIDKAIVKVTEPEKLEEYLKTADKVNYERIDENTFNFIGKSAHGSLPELGINSGIIALDVLGEVYNNPMLTLLANEYGDYNGQNMHVKYESKDMGKTTYNVGLISYKDGIFSMTVNFRHPENCNPDEVIEKVKACSPLPVTVLSKTPYLYFNPETTPFIKKLYEVYVEETGDTTNKPMAIGGGTYAKEARNTVAFGSCFPGKVDHIHEANEKIDLDDFYNSMPIYAHAIYALGTLKDEN